MSVLWIVVGLAALAVVGIPLLAGAGAVLVWLLGLFGLEVRTRPPSQPR